MAAGAAVRGQQRGRACWALVAVSKRGGGVREQQQQGEGSSGERGV